MEENDPQSPAAPSQETTEQESPPPAASSAASSTASRTASPLVGDAGPAFDPSSAQAPEPQAELHALPELEGWEQDVVEGLLTAQGSAAHALAGIGEQDWVYTEHDLAAIAPPLTRILNRYPATRAAAGTGDELAVMIGLGGYVTRSYVERRSVLMARAMEEEVPIVEMPDRGGNAPSSVEPEEIEWDLNP